MQNQGKLREKSERMKKKKIYWKKRKMETREMKGYQRLENTTEQRTINDKREQYREGSGRRNG